MEYRMRTNNSETPVAPLAYQPLGTEREYHFEIEKVKKEPKQKEHAVPFIRLFCKSNGKCGV